MGAVFPLILGVVSIVVAILAFVRASKSEGGARTKFLLLGIALVLFAGMDALQVVNALG